MGKIVQGVLEQLCCIICILLFRGLYRAILSHLEAGKLLSHTSGNLRGTAASHSERLAESSFCHDCERAMSKAALKRDPHEEVPSYCT